jgi:cobalt-zinc-cadmium efflux system protein
MRTSGDHDQGPHSHGRDATRWRLGLALALAATYMVAEVLGGLFTGSLALLADAGHMLSDVAALALALFASWVASRPADNRWTYGRTRAEILAALAQGVALVAVAVLIVFEAIERLGAPHEVKGGWMLAIAGGGLAVNLAALAVLNAGRHQSLNVRGAWLHVLSDALGSVGAMIAGALIWAFGWQWADAVASIAISLLVLWSAWHLIREAVDILMEAAPRHLDVDDILAALSELAAVRSVHDLHVWSVGHGQVALSCHVVVPSDGQSTPLLTEVYTLLGTRFGIDHATIQVEAQDFAGETPRSVCGACQPLSVAGP